MFQQFYKVFGCIVPSIKYNWSIYLRFSLRLTGFIFLNNKNIVSCKVCFIIVIYTIKGGNVHLYAVIKQRFYIIPFFLLRSEIIQLSQYNSANVTTTEVKDQDKDFLAFSPWFSHPLYTMNCFLKKLTSKYGYEADQFSSTLLSIPRKQVTFNQN